MNRFELNLFLNTKTDRILALTEFWVVYPRLTATAVARSATAALISHSDANLDLV